MTPYVIPTTRVSSRATIDFWIEAFGLELLAIYPEDATGVVDHAELRLGDGRVMAGTPRPGGVDQAIGGTSMYWVIDDEPEIDAIHARAVAAGAKSVFAPHNADYGSRHCSLRDPDGHVGRSGPTAARGDATGCPVPDHGPTSRRVCASSGVSRQATGRWHGTLSR